MRDLIERQAAIDAADSIINRDTSGNNDVVKAMTAWKEYIKGLPSAQPDNQIHLCDSCEYNYPDCPCKPNDVIFGNGKGNDNICACNKYNPSAQPEPQWIPIKTRPMTDEERNYWSENYGYDVEYEDAVIFDCKMPEDKQPVWVQSQCGYVYEDVCENDDGMLGLEGNGDWSDIVAWMPKYVPEPWRGEEHEDK